uniref:Uncharacterized protein n=1 Tax=Cucumis melo TaxID=3656 RepID=A0A9I9CV05_CUCME
MEKRPMLKNDNIDKVSRISGPLEPNSLTTIKDETSRRVMDNPTNATQPPQHRFTEHQS